MAMVINHNTDAAGALNVLGKNSKAQDTNLQRLSTGMRINGAGDDASGYSITERMQIQVRGLDQDIANSNTGKDLLQVAEGAVSNTVDILRTMKEKLINAANDTNTEDDRLIFQKEFDQMIEQIDYNAQMTKYNGKAVLDGSYNRMVLGENGDGTQSSFYNQALHIDSNTSMSDPLTSLKDARGVTLGIQENDEVIVSAVRNGTTYIKHRTIDAATSLSTVFDEILTDGDQEDGTNADGSAANKLLSASIGDQNTEIGRNVGGDKVFTPNNKGALVLKATDPGLAGQVAGVTVSIVSSTGELRLAANNVLDAFTEAIRAEEPNHRDNSLVFQVGTKASRFIKVGMSDMRARALGLRDQDGYTLQVATQGHANAAINAVEGALHKALDMQTTIGAAEMRMGITGSNLTTASENTQASESVIRDSDMAKEMTEYTRNNVLAQASQSMLAQANSNSSQVLSLLQ